ncbi:hypothetical protein Tco_0498611, partial [Tanacetum coccineum]
MSEVKKTDHSADVLASIKSQVPMVVEDHKRKHDSDDEEDDDDDEGPSAGSN